MVPVRKDHLIGSVGNPGGGPLLVCTGGIHGNEPAGLRALERIVKRLQLLHHRFQGTLLALAGNIEALSLGRRYSSLDLNRLWYRERIAGLRKPPSRPREHEDRQQYELLRILESCTGETAGEIYFLDLHTSSAPGPPFCIISDSLKSRTFAAHFPIPLILGLEEELQGTLTDYTDSLGYPSVGLEGGQHNLPTSEEHLESAVWIALAVTGALLPKDVPDLPSHYRRLARSSGRSPSIIEVRYRHPVAPGDDFVMQPDYRNLQQVQSGQLLAKDRRGDLKAPQRARLLFPLYQPQGDDGFFLGAEVHPFWLKLSAWLRPKRLERFLPWLPGVKRHPQQRDVLLVDPRVARWFTLELFHLLGFRRTASRQSLLVMARRSDQRS